VRACASRMLRIGTSPTIRLRRTRLSPWKRGIRQLMRAIPVADDGT
jgi:hypothetical protein